MKPGVAMRTERHNCATTERQSCWQPAARCNGDSKDDQSAAREAQTGFFVRHIGHPCGSYRQLEALRSGASYRCRASQNSPATTSSASGSRERMAAGWGQSSRPCTAHYTKEQEDGRALRQTQPPPRFLLGDAVLVEKRRTAAWATLTGAAGEAV